MVRVSLCGPPWRVAAAWQIAEFEVALAAVLDDVEARIHVLRTRDVLYSVSPAFANRIGYRRPTYDPAAIAVDAGCSQYLALRGPATPPTGLEEVSREDDRSTPLAITNGEEGEAEAEGAGATQSLAMILIDVQMTRFPLYPRRRSASARGTARASPGRDPRIRPTSTAMASELSRPLWRPTGTSMVFATRRRPVQGHPRTANGPTTHLMRPTLPTPIRMCSKRGRQRSSPPILSMSSSPLDSKPRHPCHPSSAP